MNAEVVKYRVAHEALGKLAGVLGKPDAWKHDYQVLTDEDIKGLPVDHELGVGRERLTWIWLARGLNLDGSAELHNGKSLIDCF